MIGLLKKAIVDLRLRLSLSNGQQLGQIPWNKRRFLNEYKLVHQYGRRDVTI